jgi:hypothetical protein
MPFIPFHDLCDEVARKETRSIHLAPGARGTLPAGVYEFVEMYCDEKDCDCRRVFFMVLSSRTQGVEAVIAWGWESRAYYAQWMGLDDPEMIAEMQGPVLNLGSPQSQYATEILDLAESLLLSDPNYVDRIKRHYAMFRAKIEHGPKRIRQVPAGSLKKGKKAKGWWRKRS